jgi:hypothetical protein
MKRDQAVCLLGETDEEKLKNCRGVTMGDIPHRASLRNRLVACHSAGLIDRFIMYPDHVVIQQGRYRHRIPARFIDAFVSGMLNYAHILARPDQVRQIAA